MKPTKVDLHLIYVCPKCEADHWVIPAETIFPGGQLCSCGYQLKFDPVEKVMVQPIYKKADIKPDVVESPSDIVKRTVSILEGQGFEKDEAFQMVLEARKKSETKNVAELVRLSLQEV